MIKEFIQSLQAADWAWVSGVGVAAMTTLIQKFSKKYKPWSWLASQLCKAMNAEMLDKLDVVEKKVDKLEKKDVILGAGDKIVEELINNKDLDDSERLMAIEYAVAKLNNILYNISGDEKE